MHQTNDQKKVSENEALLQILIDNIDSATCLYNTDKLAIVFNKRFADIYRDIFNREPEVGIKLDYLLPREEVAKRGHMFDRVLQKEHIEYETGYLNKDGRLLILKTKISPVLVDGIVTGIFTYTTDHTEAHEVEQKLKKLNRELSLLSQINDSIIQIKDAHKLMEAICDLLTADGVYNFAAISFAPSKDDFDKDVIAAVSSGTSKDFLKEISINLADDDRNQCPTSRSLLSHKTVIDNNATGVRNEADIPAAVKKYSITATIALPLIIHDDVTGVLTISSPHEEAFDTHEENVLKRVAENLVFALKTIRAVEERKKADMQLQMSLKELSIYKAALDRSFIVDITDPNGLMTQVNDNFCKISKYSREELIGKDHSVLRSNLHASESQALWTSINEGRIWRSDIQHTAKDGSKYWVDTTIVPFMNEDGKIWQFTTIRIDITQQKNDEEALARSEANMNNIFEHTHVGYVLVDADLKLMSYNHTAETFARDELHHQARIGDFMPDYFTAARKDYLLQATLEVLTGKFFVFELNYVQEDNSMHWYNLRLLPIKNSEGIYDGLIVEIVNITQKKKEEQEKEKITTDLMYRNTALEQFTYIVSHNLRAPVASIIGLTSLLTDMELTEQDKTEAIQGLATSSKKLDEVIVDINEILRIKNNVKDDKELLSFTAIADEVKTYILQYFKAQPFIIRTHFATIDSYLGIKSYVYSIFYNLISNSIKYSKPGLVPEIDIRSFVEDKTLILHFADNGIGINMKQNKDQLFGIYRRFHVHVEGKGLGLFMVKTQVEMLGGTIDVQSEEGMGTSFTIRLPL